MSIIAQGISRTYIGATLSSPPRAAIASYPPHASLLPHASQFPMLNRTLLWLIFSAVSASSAAAQSMDDGWMMPKRTLTVGVVYSHDSWDQYWEGTLKRTNGNIGTLTTQSTTLVGAYGVTER